jgi:hypothetical protein
MKKLFFLAILVLVLVYCKKEPTTGDLFVKTEYDGVGEENVEVWLYESYDKFIDLEYLESQLSDEYGAVNFYDLEAGWYIVEAQKQKSYQFTVYAADSVEIRAGRKTNKILILNPAGQ